MLDFVFFKYKQILKAYLKASVVAATKNKLFMFIQRQNPPWNAFHVKTSQPAKILLDSVGMKIGPKSDIHPFCMKAFS